MILIFLLVSFPVIRISVFGWKCVYWNFRHVVGTSYTSILGRPSTPWRKKTKTSDNHQNFWHFVGTSYTFILIWPSASCRKKLKTSDGGRNFRPWVGTSDQHWAAELVKCVENCRKNQKNAKSIVLASYLHALHGRTIKCMVWQLILCNFVYAK